VKILIVEDSVSIRNNLKKFISEIKSFDVIGEAEDSAPAITIIKDAKPDIIILDVELKKAADLKF
jgi:SARP family transcriptional regulator, regulator of embCAB operon